MATTSPTRSASPPSSLPAAAAARQLQMPPTAAAQRTPTTATQMQPTPQLAESALLQGRFDAAASVGLSLLSGSRGPAASRGACVAVQALYELGRFDEAHAALSEGFGGPLAIPADVLLLWSALGLDAGEPLKVAAALSSFLDASTVPGGAGRGAAGPAAPPPSGPVLGPDQFEAAARMLLCEALIKEARSPAAARAWVAAGGAARSGLPAARAAALAAEVEAAASAAEASESLAGEMVERSVVFSSRRGASASGNGEGKEEEEKRQRATAAAAAVTAPLAASSPAPVDASAALLPSGSKGSTVALGTVMRGGVVLRSTSFIASTPDRLAELWSSGSGGSGGEAPATDEAALSSAARRQRWPTIDGPPSSSPLSSSIPASIYSVQAAAAAALGAVVAYAAFAERRSLARAGRSGLRALASTLGLALRVTPA